MKLRQLGANLLVQKEDGKIETIVFPKGYNFDKVFSLAYKAQESQAAKNALEKELDKYRKQKVKDPVVTEKRIERKKLEKKLKSVEKPIPSTIKIEELPITLTEEWKQVLDTKEDQTGLKNFLIWLSLNDNAHTRENFLKSFSAKYPYITKSGFIVSVRSVWKEKKAADELGDFIQSSYVKIKGQKKGVKNFVVIRNKANSYELRKADSDILDPIIGNLQELKDTYKSEDKTIYVSDYSKRYLNRSDNWTLGSVAEIHDKATHQEICGINQLHILSNPKDVVTGKNQGYGDTKLLVLVNPKDVINISEGWKYTTSRFYIAAEITPEEIDTMFTEHWGQFEYDYLQYDIENLQKEAVKEKSKESLKAYKTISSSIKEEIKNLKLNNKSDHLEPLQYNKILENRIKLLDKQ